MENEDFYSKPIDFWNNNLFFMKPGTSMDVFHEYASVSN